MKIKTDNKVSHTHGVRNDTRGRRIEWTQRVIDPYPHRVAGQQKDGLKYAFIKPISLHVAILGFGCGMNSWNIRTVKAVPWKIWKQSINIQHWWKQQDIWEFCFAVLLKGSVLAALENRCSSEQVFLNSQLHPNLVYPQKQTVTLIKYFIMH